jgi:hypothetical protein
VPPLPLPGERRLFAFQLPSADTLAASLTDQLDSVQTAIAALESGEREVMVGRRQFGIADLATLYSRERSLKNEIARSTSGGGIRMRRIIPRG